jgi:hypothetical protein
MTDLTPETPQDQPSPSAVPVPEGDAHPLAPGVTDPVLDAGDRRST